MRKILDITGDLMLFHAQFPAKQRTDLENLCIKKFGKDKSSRPKCAILVATQVVEQSLDVDFSPYLSEPARPPRYADTTFARSSRSIDPGGTCAYSRYRLHIAVCDIEDCIDFRSLYLRGCIASRFRIAALVLLCLRLNLTSRLRLQG